MTKYKIAKVQTTGVILARVAENGDLAGQTIKAADCLSLLKEDHKSILNRLNPSKFKGSPYDKKDEG